MTDTDRGTGKNRFKDKGRQLEFTGREFESQQDQTLHSDLGHKAKVRREDLKDGEKKERATRQLKAIGVELLPIPALTYMGSAAVHIYQAPALGEIFFVSQTGIEAEVSEVTASAACESLIKDVAKQFQGRIIKKKRSGF